MTKTTIARQRNTLQKRKMHKTQRILERERERESKYPEKSGGDSSREKKVEREWAALTGDSMGTLR